MTITVVLSQLKTWLSFFWWSLQSEQMSKEDSRVFNSRVIKVSPTVRRNDMKGKWEKEERKRRERKEKALKGNRGGHFSLLFLSFRCYRNNAKGYLFFKLSSKREEIAFYPHFLSLLVVSVSVLHSPFCWFLVIPSFKYHHVLQGISFKSSTRVMTHTRKSDTGIKFLSLTRLLSCLVV